MLSFLPTYFRILTIVAEIKDEQYSVMKHFFAIWNVFLFNLEAKQTVQHVFIRQREGEGGGGAFGKSSKYFIVNISLSGQRA